MKKYVGKEKKPDGLKIIPLGGLEQIGMNITAFEYGDSVIIVDCGMAFPEDDMLGVDLVVPEITYLKENAAKKGSSSHTDTRTISGRCPMYCRRSTSLSLPQGSRWGS